MTGARVVSDRRFTPAMDMSRSDVEDQLAARAASIQAVQRVRVAAMLAARTGDFTDIAEALGLDGVTS